MKGSESRDKVCSTIVMDAINDRLAVSKYNEGNLLMDKKRYEDAVRCYEIAANQGLIEAIKRLIVLKFVFLAEQPSIKKNIAAKTLSKIISMSSESVLEKIVEQYELLEKKSKEIEDKSNDKFYGSLSDEYFEKDNKVIYINATASEERIRQDILRSERYELLKILTKKENPFGLYKMGEYYYWELQGLINEKKGEKYFVKAAEKGHILAMKMCAEIFSMKFGPWNEKKAFEWYKKAAQMGDEESLYDLGECFYSGTGTKKDIKEAVKCFMQSSQKGCIMAQYKMGDLYSYGQGVEKDNNKAIEWYVKAAEHKYVSINDYPNDIHSSKSERVKQRNEACIKCADIYYDGKIVKRDLKKAKYWYNEAGTDGIYDVAHLHQRRRELERY